MNNPDHVSESLRNYFLGLKYLNSLMRIRDPGWKIFGSGMEKIRIRDKHPSSATLVLDRHYYALPGLKFFEIISPHRENYS